MQLNNILYFSTEIDYHAFLVIGCLLFNILVYAIRSSLDLGPVIETVMAKHQSCFVGPSFSSALVHALDHYLPYSVISVFFSTHVNIL